MNVFICIDAFKGSMSSMEAGNACTAGIRRVFSEADITILPLADGGEGTTEALVTGLHGEYRMVKVSDPLGRLITAQYGILPDGAAVIEMAAASGLPLLAEAERNPMKTTTFGFGEMISDAVKAGCRNFILGIGGSATNDGGIGCLQALGFDFLDADGQPVPFGAEGVMSIAAISDNRKMPELQDCSFHVACDVKNPLCGESGCSAVFAPQKGADDAMVVQMDAALARFAKLTKNYYPDADADFPGAGAAGGLGFGLMSYLNATLEPGVELILRETNIEESVKCADFVITGEGCLDGQTAMGKAPIGIARLAKSYGKPVVAFSGAVRAGAESCNQTGIDAYFPIIRQIESLEDAMQSGHAAKNLADAAEQVFRLIKSVTSYQ